MLTFNTKSILAKLLAKENIFVEHHNVSTASFDLKSRTLIIPTWKNISADLYDLLIGHEVGHALETPPEGWHTAVVDARHSNKPNFKNFLNVIEDVRIEKKMKRRYEGLKRSFRRGYEELIFDRDFFGITKEKLIINDLALIDRMNIHFKGVIKTVQFRAEEQKFLDRLTRIESWNDVCILAEDLYEFSKHEPINVNPFKDEGKNEEKEDGDIEQDMSPEEEELSDVEQEEEKETTNVEEGEQEKEEEEGEETRAQRQANPYHQKNEGEEEHIPQSLTDQEFRKNQTLLLDTDPPHTLYINLPTPNLNSIITPAKRVNELLNENFEKVNAKKEKWEVFKKFQEKNDRYIALLTKEFEMRKAATRFKKAKLHNTGDIDINKLYRYRYDDNIFRKMMQMQDGKSHGLVFLIDKSGSMNSNIAGAFEQTFILTGFCRKVRIPFAVYGFTNSSCSRSIDFPKETARTQFKIAPMDMVLTDFSLREIVNSEMNMMEYQNAVANHLYLGELYTPNGKSHAVSIPPQEHMSGTPLNEALIATNEIIGKFKEKHRVEIINLIIVHDGDAAYTNMYTSNDGHCKQFHLSYDCNVFLRDKKNNHTVNLRELEKARQPITAGIMDLIQQRHGIEIVGFYITTPTHIQTVLGMYYKDKDKRGIDNLKPEQNTELLEFFRKEKFIESYTEGYNRFFFIPGGQELTVTNSSLTNGAPRHRLITEFRHLGKKKIVNRVLIRKFIEIIAKHELTNLPK